MKDMNMKEVKQTYTQNWPAYNLAQINEQKLFMKLLADLCNSIKNPDYNFGRPRVPLSDIVFISALKVYSTFSLRRFMGFLDTAFEKGYVGQKCAYTTISEYMKDKSLTKVLHNLIELSSLPLVAVEQDFAIDSSGFSISKFGRFLSYKHRGDIRYKSWIKASVCCGVSTNIVTSVKLSGPHKGDSLYFEGLVKNTAKNFNIREMSADKAYLSRNNLDVVKKYGGQAFIPFKSNSIGNSRGSSVWRHMYLYFEMHNEEFMKHYHKRSNIESVFAMIKAKFLPNVRSKNKVAQNNEVLLKFLCHNITVLIMEIHELGIDPKFNSLQG